MEPSNYGRRKVSSGALLPAVRSAITGAVLRPRPSACAPPAGSTAILAASDMPLPAKSAGRARHLTRPFASSLKSFAKFSGPHAGTALADCPQGRDPGQQSEMLMSLASGVGGGFSPAALQQLQQYLFNKIDTNGDGSVSQGELETTITNAGGSTQAADALYSLLDPNSSGGFDEQQFAQAFPSSGLSDG